MDTLVKSFLERKMISLDMEFHPLLQNAIEYLEKADRTVEALISEDAERLSQEPPWRVMYDMYLRNYEYCSGAISLFLVGQPASCEALCRTAIEGAVNLEYISIGDAMGNEIAYFKHYLKEERKQNRAWHRSVKESASTQSDKDVHYKKIDLKNQSLDSYEEILKSSLALCDVDFDNCEADWPNIFERFKSLGKEVEYRTLYMALCSQAHNDAEDIINKIMARVVGDVDGMSKAHFIEQVLYSLFYTLSAVRYHIHATIMFLAKFEVQVTDLVSLREKTLEDLGWIAENMHEIINECLVFK
ncbi:DUF5677 domain-containing protein [Vibrio vulnificus]|uniref:DUF5677 domain-containing protein n=1 Tax=Vibrio vulnificus TaxID=672 RepID=UPI0040594266